MKKEYELPLIEIIFVEKEDIITQSSTFGLFLDGDNPADYEEFFR